MTQLALVIDLNVCVGCHACVTSCKQWNTSGSAGAMSDDNPYAAEPTGTFFNRVQTFEVGEFPHTETVHFPKSCLHCEDGRVYRSVLLAPVISAKKMVLSWSTTTSVSVAAIVHGPALMVHGNWMSTRR